MPELADGLEWSPPNDAPNMWATPPRAPMSYEGQSPAMWEALMRGTPQSSPSLWPDAQPPANPVERDAFEAAALKTRAPYRNIAAPGSSNLEPIAESLTPKEPWEYGLAMLLPGESLIGRGLSLIPKGVRAGIAAASAAISPSEAEAGTKRALLERIIKAGTSDPEASKLLYGGAHDPNTPLGNWIVRYSKEGAPRLLDSAEGQHGFSAVKTGLPVDQMSFKINNPPQFNRNIWDIADREGDTMIFGVKDRTRAGGQLAEVGDRKLRRPVQLEGGADYSLLHEGTPVHDTPEARLLYANQQGPANKIIREAQEVADKGGTPLFTTMVMGKGAGDSARQLANTTLRLAKQSRPDAQTIEMIDRSMAAEMPAPGKRPVEPYPGFASPQLEAWLNSTGGAYRGAFVRALDKAKIRDRTGIDMGEVRYANTDPRLVNTPTGSSGLFMGEVAPELGITPNSMHSNYPWAFMTKSAPGGLQGSVPFKTLAPDLWRGLMKAGEPKYFADNPMTYIMGEMPNGLGKSQKITPEVVDGVSEFFRRNPQGWATAGAVGAGATAAALAPGSEAQAGPLDAIRKGIKAFHSSPHDIDKFDINKVGTGQGAQVYGHGLYFAENPKVSGQGGEYWNEFLHKFPDQSPEHHAASVLKQNNFDRSAAIADTEKNVNDLRGWLNKVHPDVVDQLPKPLGFDRDSHAQMSNLLKLREQQLELLKSGNPVGPRTYEVNINAHPDQLLNWDRPLGEHSGSVIDAVRPLVEPTLERSAAARARMLGGEGRRSLTEADRARLSRPVPPLEETQGSQIYKFAGLPANTPNEGSVKSAAALREAGIPGIKYLDQGSRVRADDVANVNKWATEHGGPEAALQLAREKLAAATKDYGEGSANARGWRDTITGLTKPLTSNYVMFDDKLIDILKKYGVFGGAVGAGAPSLWPQEARQ